MHKPIILASASEIRRQMLDNAGVVHRVEVARIDETSVKAAMQSEGANPREIADKLAEMKALRVSGKHPEALVIGSDQVLEFGHKMLNKPKDIQEARTQLCELRGQQHKLLSAAVIANAGRIIWRHTGQTRLWMREFTDEYLDDYLTRQGDDILSSVGGYKIESEGLRLFAKIEGDYFNILGLPLLELLNYLVTSGALKK